MPLLNDQDARHQDQHGAHPRSLRFSSPPSPIYEEENESSFDGLTLPSLDAVQEAGDPEQQAENVAHNGEESTKDDASQEGSTLMGSSGSGEDDDVDNENVVTAVPGAVPEFGEFFDDVSPRRPSRVVDDNSKRPIVLLGGYLSIPRHNCCLDSTWQTALSSCIARHAPCFWFCQPRLQTGATGRAILFRLNIVCAFFAAAQIASGIWLWIVLVNDKIADRAHLMERDETKNYAPNLWNLNGSVLVLTLVLGSIILFTMLFTLRVIKRVNLLGSIRYMWALVWFLPFEIFLVVSLFDYFKVTDVWIKHWWNLPVMAWFREEFCQDGTSRTLCTVPIGGIPTDLRLDEDNIRQFQGLLQNGGQFTYNQTAGEMLWCLDNYNATNCTEIRNEAQKQTGNLLYAYYTMNAVWGLLLIVLLLLAIHTLEGIISKPIVQKSRESNVPGWLTLPTVGCTVTGIILLYSPTSILSSDQSMSDNHFWIAIIYLIAGGLFFFGALLGWFISAFTILNPLDKRTKQCAINLFIATLTCTSLAVVTIFIASLFFSHTIVDVGVDDIERGNLACSIDTADSCSFCNNRFGLRQCPQWTDDDVVKILRTQLKNSATVAAIFICYSFGALRFGFMLRKHVSEYQIDYV